MLVPVLLLGTTLSLLVAVLCADKSRVSKDKAQH
jgi:hypothetical protein